MSVLRVKLDEGEAQTAIAWLESYLEQFDLSKLSRLTIDHGRGNYDGVWGTCYCPRRRRFEGGFRGIKDTYRISCHVGRNWPYGIATRKSPLYKNSDRTSWVRRYSVTPVHNVDEAVVWITAHELAHFLSRTRQVPGVNSEIQADAFADARLSEFRRGVNT